MIYYRLLCCFLILLPLEGIAQGISQKNKHYIDISMGVNLPLFAISNDGLGRKLLNGDDTFTGSLSLRYQYFFNQKWGGFIDMQFTSNSISNYDDLPMDVKPDKDNYYLLGGNENPNPDILRYTYLAGVVRRYDTRNWSFRPYLGIGLGFVRMRAISFQMKGIGNNQVYESDLQLKEGKNSVYTMALSPGIYVAWKFSSDVHLFADVNYIQHLQSIRYVYKETDSYTGNTIKENQYSAGMNCYLNINAGISIPLWYNKRR